jgi:hypothetical protein
MCENISKKNINSISLNLNKKDNPKLVIEPVTINTHTINIIQDGVLLAGTKQRVAKKFFKNGIFIFFSVI